MDNWGDLAPSNSVSKVIESLKSKEYGVLLVETGKEALDKIKELIPKGATVMNGASVTLEKIGYTDYLKSGNTGWENIHEQVLAEKDPVKQKQLRKLATISDYYLGSVHALTEGGEFLVASNTASQIPSISYSSDNLIFVVGTQKIVPDVASALRRIESYILPLEDARMKEKYGMGTYINKILVFKGENANSGRMGTVIGVTGH